MSNDLVKRLRHPVGGMRPTISDGRAAADRIEELEAKLAVAVAELDRFNFDWECITGREIKGEGNE